MNFRRLLPLMAIFVILLGLCGCSKNDTSGEVNTLLATGKYDQAVVRLQESIREKPSDPELHYMLGLAYAGSGKFDRAIDEYQIALSLAPNREDIEYEMAKASWKLGNRLVPIKIFLKVLRGNPTTSQEKEILDLAAEKYRVTEITDSQSDNASPIFSPDGEKLAYVRMTRGRNVIVVRDLVKGTEEVITPKGVSESSPSFSPNGNYLFVSSVRTDGQDRSKLARINLVTGEREILFEWDKDIIKPNVSPDGRKIAFMAMIDGNWEIFKLDLDAKTVVRLTDNKSDDIDPRFSPNGLTIVFASKRNGAFNIYRMNNDGSNQNRLTNTPDADISPTYSFDGERIAFVTDRNGSDDIYMMSKDGTDVVRLTNYHGKDITPSFSPDGQKIAFASARNSSYLQINLIDLSRETTREEMIAYLENLAKVSWK